MTDHHFVKATITTLLIASTFAVIACESRSPNAADTSNVAAAELRLVPVLWPRPALENVCRTSDDDSNTPPASSRHT